MYLKKYPLRFSLIFISLILCLCIFSVKLILIQVFRSENLISLAEKQHNYYVKLEPVRGTIYDRKFRPQALNVPAYSLYANPRVMTVRDKRRAVKELSLLLDIDPEYLKSRVNRNKYFIWLARKLPVEYVDKIKDLKIRGLDFVKESQRFYPNQELAAHIIGFAGIDNQGLEGLELQYEKFLKGQDGWSKIIRDARHQELQLETAFFPPRDGFNLVLTIDETVQYIAEHALQKAYEKHNAKAGSIIVMNPKTGEILALANRPTYNLQEASRSAAASRTNRAIAFMYEPGSVFKVVTAAAALEEKVFHETDTIFCENGRYRVANHILHDHHGYGNLTFREVIEQSSNIGMTKVAQKLGPDLVYEYAKRFRFGKATGIDLLGEVSGVLKPPSRWSKTSIAAIPIGHEVGVTPLQLVSAISAIANDGVYMKPFVVKYIADVYGEVIRAFEPTALDTVITPDTAHRLKSILTGVVEKGTGKRAQIEGVAVAGKTGTAQKIVDGTYSHNKFYATFYGFAPVDDPQVAIVVVYDEPHPSYFGGTVAAPVFQEVMENVLKYLESEQ